MKTNASLILLAACALCFVMGAPAQSKPPLIDSDIVQMVSSGFQEEMVIGSISASEVNFDVSPSALLGLKKANVSDKIIQAMLEAEKKSRDDAARLATRPAATYASSSRIGVMGVPIMSSGAQAPAQLPKVTLIVGGRRIPMQASTTEIANSKGKGGSAAGGILKGLGKGMMMATRGPRG